ncbi:hypothetical protein [Amycolatopsis sp. NPDC004378]
MASSPSPHPDDESNLPANEAHIDPDRRTVPDVRTDVRRGEKSETGLDGLDEQLVAQLTKRLPESALRAEDRGQAAETPGRGGRDPREDP